MKKERQSALVYIEAGLKVNPESSEKLYLILKNKYLGLRLRLDRAYEFLDYLSMFVEKKLNKIDNSPSLIVTSFVNYLKDVVREKKVKRIDLKEYCSTLIQVDLTEFRIYKDEIINYVYNKNSLTNETIRIFNLVYIDELSNKKILKKLNISRSRFNYLLSLIKKTIKEYVDKKRT